MGGGGLIRQFKVAEWQEHSPPGVMSQALMATVG